MTRQTDRLTWFNDTCTHPFRLSELGLSQHQFPVLSSRPMAAFAGNASQGRRVFNASKTARETVPRRVAAQAKRITGIIHGWVQPGPALLSSFYTGLEAFKSTSHGGPFPGFVLTTVASPTPLKSHVMWPRGSGITERGGPQSRHQEAY